MNEITEIKNLLQQHIVQSNNNTLEIKQSLAKIEVHNDYTKASISDYEKRLKRLEHNNFKQIGFLSAVSIGLTLLYEWLKSKF